MVTLDVDASIKAAFMLEATRAGESGPWTVSAVLNPEGAVDGVKVRPELATGEEVTPMTISGADVTLVVKTIPGLWYSVITSTSLAQDAVWTVETDSVVQATTETDQTELSAHVGTGNVRFYKVQVSETNPTPAQ